MTTGAGAGEIAELAAGVTAWRAAASSKNARAPAARHALMMPCRRAPR